jgi:hypothetical protein
MRGGDTEAADQICEVALDPSTSEVTHRLKLSQGQLWEIQATGLNAKRRTLGNCGLSLFVPDRFPGWTGASGTGDVNKDAKVIASGSCVCLPDGRSGVVTGRMAADNGWNVKVHGGSLTSFSDGILVTLPTAAITVGSRLELSDGRTGVFNRWLPDGKGWVMDIDGGAEETFHAGALPPTVQVGVASRVRLADVRACTAGGSFFPVDSADEAAGCRANVDKELGLKANKAPCKERFSVAPDWAVRFR